MEFTKCRDVSWKGPEKRNKPDVAATTAKHPDSRSQISRYGWMQPACMRSVSFLGKFTSGSRISASRSDLLKLPIFTASSNLPQSGDGTLSHTSLQFHGFNFTKARMPTLSVLVLKRDVFFFLNYNSRGSALQSPSLPFSISFLLMDVNIHERSGQSNRTHSLTHSLTHSILINLFIKLELNNLLLPPLLSIVFVQECSVVFRKVFEEWRLERRTFLPEKWWAWVRVCRDWFWRPLRFHVFIVFHS